MTGVQTCALPILKQQLIKYAKAGYPGLFLVTHEEARAEAAGPVEESDGVDVQAPEVPEDSYAGRLLAARKKARDRQDRR